MKHLIAFVGGYLDGIIANQNQKITDIMAKFTELTEYVAKNIVTKEEVDSLIAKEVAAAHAELATTILADAKAYTDTVDMVNDSASEVLTGFVNQIAEKLNTVGGIVGTPVVAPVVETPAPVVDAPVVDAPVVDAPAPTTGEIGTPVNPFA